MTIPQEVKNIIAKLQEAGFEAYAVGGCVRDLLLARQNFSEKNLGGLRQKPKDWDIATNALPEQVQSVFSDSFYENEFGTVGVKTGSEDKSLKIVEVTTYRVDAKYTDKRHPDSVSFTQNLQEDLARRDFTINAMALRLVPQDGTRSGQAPGTEIIDPFGGQEDLAKGVIRAVGEPEKRFNEDALRMLRAVRFSVELCFAKVAKPISAGDKKIPPTPPLKRGERFVIEETTKAAIKKNAKWLQAVSKERVRDELVRIIMSSCPDEGIVLLHDLDLLQYIIPELVKGVGVAQNRHHIYTIFEHGVFSLKFAAHPVKFSKSEINETRKKSDLVVRLAALLHDVAKPQAKRGEGPDATFYNHDIMGARAAARILERLHFSNDIIERVANLVRHHMFVYDVGAVTEAGVRRLLVRVGPANMADLLALRVADRLGSGVPKAQPYRLRHFQYMVERVQHDPISVKMLKINGSDIMEILKIEPGPKIGAMLDVILAEVVEDPAKNEKKSLAKRVKELNEVDLAQLRQLAKARIEEEKEEEDKVIKNKYWVK